MHLVRHALSHPDGRPAVNASAVVIGIGNSFRRDDGIGPAVAAEIARRGLPGIRVLRCAAEPTAILDAWEGATRVVLIDAAVDGIPGRVRRCAVEELALSAAVSSHDLSLRQTVELGRALGGVPDSVNVVSVDVADTGHGEGLTPAVRAALPEAVRAVLDILGAPQESTDQEP
jgi:hydrogenase maturation protease